MDQSNVGKKYPPKTPKSSTTKTTDIKNTEGEKRKPIENQKTEEKKKETNTKTEKS